MKRLHLIFYDADCPLCQRSVQAILKLDKAKIFLFAPLDGKTASQELKPELLKENTLILLEHYQKPMQRQWIRGRAVSRILWLIGGKWRFLGWLCYVPFGVDLAYRFVAHHRHFVKIKNKIKQKPSSRFLS